MRSPIRRAYYNRELVILESETGMKRKDHLVTTDPDATPKEWAESLTFDELTEQLNVISDSPNHLNRGERKAIIAAAIDRLKYNLPPLD